MSKFKKKHVFKCVPQSSSASKSSAQHHPSPPPPFLSQIQTWMWHHYFWVVETTYEQKCGFGISFISLVEFLWLIFSAFFNSRLRLFNYTLLKSTKLGLLTSSIHKVFNRLNEMIDGFLRVVVPTFVTKITEYLCSSGFFSSGKYWLLN